MLCHSFGYGRPLSLFLATGPFYTPGAYSSGYEAGKQFYFDNVPLEEALCCESLNDIIVGGYEAGFIDGFFMELGRSPRWFE